MRGEVRLGFLLYRSWGRGGGGRREYERIKKIGEKAIQIAHSRTMVPVLVSAVSVPKVYYRFFSGLVPVLVSVVPVPLCYCHFFLGWYWYQ